MICENRTEIHIRGDVNLFSSPKLKRAILESFSEPKVMTIHLRHLRYIDSSGLAVLITSQNEFRKRGGQFFLADLTPHIRKLLKLTSLDKYFQVIEIGGIA